MAVSSERKQVLVAEFGKNARDCGSSEAQIAILTERINDITQHLKDNPKDFSSRRGLLKMVGRRRHLLDYLKHHTTPEYYKKLLKSLNLRK